MLKSSFLAARQADFWLIRVFIVWISVPQELTPLKIKSSQSTARCSRRFSFGLKT